MAWCDASTVATLINTARVCPKVSPEERKTADLELISLYNSAVNIGDVLTTIVTDDTLQSSVIRLNAALALEPLLEEKGWTEGAKFSDTSSSRDALLRCAFASPEQSASAATSPALSAALMRCVALIATLEYPLEPWEVYVQGAAHQHAQEEHLTPHEGSRAGATIATNFLLSLARVAHTSHALWGFLAGAVTEQCVSTYTQSSTSAWKQETLTIFLHLLERRPRPAEGISTYDKDNCFLLSGSMHNFVTQCIQHHVQLGSAVCDEREAGLLLAIAQRCLRTPEVALSVFHACCSLLTGVRAKFVEFQGVVDECSNLLLENCLGCLLGVLQSFPELLREETATALAEMLYPFMQLGGTTEEDALSGPSPDPEDLQSALLEMLVDDEAVPLGCGEGSLAAACSSILELFLEAADNWQICAVAELVIQEAQRALTEMSTSPSRVARLQPLVSVLRCLVRVCEAKDEELSLLDLLCPDASRALVGNLCAYLRVSPEPYDAACLIELLARCFGVGKQMECRQQYLEMLTEIWTAASVNPLNRAVWCVSSIAVYAAGELIAPVSADVPPSTLFAADAWAERAVTCATTHLSQGHAHLLSVYCGATSFCVLLAVCPEQAWRQLHLSDANTLRSVVGLADAVCECCRTRAFSRLLTTLLRRLCEHQRLPDGNAAASCAAFTVISERILALCTGALASGQAPHLVMRALADFVSWGSKAQLETTGNPLCCSKCMSVALVRCGPHVVQYAATQGPFDEGTARALAHSITCAAITLASAGDLSLCSPAARALGVLTTAALDSELPSVGVANAVAGFLAAVSLACPSLLDMDYTPLTLHLFTHPALGRSGVNCSGPCLLFALVCLRHPAAFLSVMEQSASLASGEDASAAGAWGSALGWWCSVAPFADSYVMPYYTASWYHILSVLMGGISCDDGASAKWTASTHSLPGCALWHIQSLHQKRPTAQLLLSASIAEALAFAFLGVKHRFKNTSKVRLLDPALSSVLSVQNMYVGVAGRTFGDGLGSLAFVLSLSVTDMADWMLARVAEMGHDAAIQRMTVFFQAR